MAYRSPEMIDFYRKQPITEKADIWVCSSGVLYILTGTVGSWMFVVSNGIQ